MPRRFLLGLSGLALLFPCVARADHPIPTKIDAGINFRFNVQMGPQAYIPRAPWYTYFPADPQLLARAPGTTPYPTWPQAFPPAQPQVPPVVPGPVAPTGYQAVGWATPAQPGTPVGYQPAQVPSYWYGR